jgi:hypothetical protein
LSNVIWQSKSVTCHKCRKPQSTAFVCLPSDWHYEKTLGAHQALGAAWDDFDNKIGEIAEPLLRTGSPRPQKKSMAFL